MKQHLFRFAELEETLSYLQSLPPNGKREKIRKLKEKLNKYSKWKYKKNNIIQANYRPFFKQFYYADTILSDRLTQNHYDIFGTDLERENKLVGFVAGTRLDFATYITNLIPNLATFSLDPARWLPLYRYTSEGERIDNITDWALDLFRAHYEEVGIQRLDIFHYVYGVLHNPAYRQKYEQNLKRDFPRIPLYENFWFWVEAGKKLMDLHLHYEEIAPFALERQESELKRGTINKPRLKADKDKGIIYLDQTTSLHGVPATAWDYKLGNRSALE
ncbi:MAG: hypothetical protein JJT94_04380 [Bernardetiaceae bacterium]|nr:hypothetical protein [Bernardetiaceae bacterium]